MAAETPPADLRLLYIGPPETAEHVRENLPAGWSVVVADTADGVDAALPSADAVLDASMRIRFDAARIARAPRLRLYTTATTGADHVDADALAARGVPLLTLLGQTEVLAGLTAAAEHSWLLLMACARHLLPASRAVLQGEWNRARFPGTMLRGRTLGIVGCGRIGQWMSRYGRAFGMTCLGYDPKLEVWPDSIRSTGLEALMRSSDFVTVHVPLSDATRGLVGEAELGMMRPGAVLVNTSRGEIVDEAGVLASLEAGRLGAYGADVLSGEPDIVTHPLVEYARGHDNVVLTPHIGGFSPDALRVVLAFSCSRINDFFDEA